MPHPGPEQIAQARRELVEKDPNLARAHAATPAFAWRARPGGYEGLVRMIVEQQVSVASAAAIWERTLRGLDGAVTPHRVLDASPEILRGFGLSGQKTRYVKELAAAQLEGRIDLDAMGRLSDVDAVTVLTAIPGVGRWTAETFLMFCEGRTDVFPGGDIALQEAIRWADRTDERPREKVAVLRAELWRPHRSVAAHLLWGWYGAVKRGEIRLEE